MAERRTNIGRFTSDPRHRERLIRQVMRARRSVDADMRWRPPASGDAAKVAVVERAKKWAPGDRPGLTT